MMARIKAYFDGFILSACLLAQNAENPVMTSSRMRTAKLGNFGYYK